MNAPDREEVFMALRKQHIRPIKVIRKDDLNPKPRFVISAWWAVWLCVGLVVAALAIGVWWGLAKISAKEAERTRYRIDTKAAWQQLESKALAVEERHNSSLKLLNLEMMQDYSALATASDISVFTNEVTRARAVIEESRKAMHDLFCDLYNVFPPESVNERRDAQKLYGRIMTAIDLSEERINADEIIVGLLFSNRSAWSVQDGKIVFTDQRLESEFRYFGKDTDAESSRWQKDFGPKSPHVIESAPVEVPFPSKKK